MSKSAQERRSVFKTKPDHLRQRNRFQINVTDDVYDAVCDLAGSWHTTIPELLRIFIERGLNSAEDGPNNQEET